MKISFESTIHLNMSKTEKMLETKILRLVRHQMYLLFILIETSQEDRYVEYLLNKPRRVEIREH